ncbi:DUF445 domain-containing protein [Dendrosporobacter sp. 1207_IL3150]|uniref:DUF445 domain-containing protein n=1 Tax=Dendrosporobacter sp. 1207_IL3150 TaxID=3084054 RepID=UPI002FD8D454
MSETRVNSEMKTNRNKAAVTLGIASVGLLASFPYRGYFWGGLLMSGCQAAVVGGLADWFAVTALFRKPLGIPFRTAIIPRNREKIFQAVTEMVQAELLSKDNIMKALDSYDISEVLLHFLDDHNGRKYLRDIIYKFAYKFIEQLDANEIAHISGSYVRKQVKNGKLVPLILEAVQWLIDHNVDDKILSFALEQIEKIANHKQMQSLLADLFVETRKSYERGLERRRVFNKIIDLEPNQVAADTQSSLLNFLEELKDHNHPFRSKLKERFHKTLTDPNTAVLLQQQIENLLDGKFNLEQHIADNFADWRNKAISDGEDAAWLNRLSNQANQIIDEFADSMGKREKLNTFAKTLLSEWFDKNHAEIGILVKESLEKMSDEKLVEFIEDKVGNDLQMIRINGSVVGGFVGMLIYLMTFWW